MGNYYRYRPSMGFGGFVLTPAVKILLIINAALYVIPALLNLDLLATPLGLLYLVPALVLRYGMIWQVFTYMFFHGGFMHFLFNMLTLWMFGTAVEQAWGTRRFAAYYLLCGVAAGICVVLVALFSGSGLVSATIGSSGAIYGLILAFGLLFPDTPVYFMFLFPLPAKYFAILMACIEFFMQWAQPGSGISHIAHLGGMLFGLLYIRLWLPLHPALVAAPRPPARYVLLGFGTTALDGPGQAGLPALATPASPQEIRRIYARAGTHQGRAGTRRPLGALRTVQGPKSKVGWRP